MNTDEDDRRTLGPTPTGRFAFGPFVLDPAERRLSRAGLPRKIQPQPFRLLTLLVESRGRLLTRETLREELWGKDLAVDHEHGLNFAINQIRTALGDPARDARYVETVPRAGYRFVAPVRRLGNHPTTDRAPAPGETADLDGGRAHRSRRRERRVAPRAAAPLLVALLVGFTLGWLRG